VGKNLVPKNGILDLPTFYNPKRIALAGSSATVMMFPCNMSFGLYIPVLPTECHLRGIC
jgi:hypothetical protein